jgi:hypothetical protein
VEQTATAGGVKVRGSKRPHSESAQGPPGSDPFQPTKTPTEPTKKSKADKRTPGAPSKKEFEKMEKQLLGAAKEESLKQ